MTLCCGTIQKSFIHVSCMNANLFIQENAIITAGILAQVTLFIAVHITHCLKHCVTCQNFTLTEPLETKDFKQFFQTVLFIMPFKSILFCLMSLANCFTGVIFLTRNSYKLKLSNGERRKRKRDRLRNGEVLRRNFSHNMKNYKERDKLRSEEKWKPRIVLLIRGESWIFTVNTISQCSFAFY